MAAVTFDALYFSLVVFFSAIIPGIAVAFPLLRKSELGITEKLVLAFFIGLVLPSSLMVVENTFGVPFSLTTALVNIAIVTILGAFFWVKLGMAKMPSLPSFDSLFSNESIKAGVVPVMLILILFLSYWVRLSTYSPIYSELDPYFYIYGTGQIIQTGTTPYPGQEDTAWWPEGKMQTHRAYPPLKMFIEAQWYALYTGGAAYDKFVLFLTSCWLPAVSGALLAAGAYFVISAYIDRRYGLLAAFLVAFSPVDVFKMSAGVNEAGPLGMASILLVPGLFALALKKKDYSIAAVAALAFFTTSLATNYESIIMYSLAAMMISYMVLDFLLGKKEQALHGHGHSHSQAHQGAKPDLVGALKQIAAEPFVAICAITISGFIIANVLQPIYLNGISGITGFLELKVMIALASIAAVVLLAYAKGLNIPSERKFMAAGAIAIFAILVILVPNPIGTIAKDQISNYVGAAAFNFPLQRTIAEQNEAGTNFEGSLGFLGLIPANHVMKVSSASSTDEKAALSSPNNIALNLFYISLDKIAVLFTFIGNLASGLATAIANIVLAHKIDWSNKDPSILFVFLVLSTIFLAWVAFFKRDDKSTAATALFILFLILPITFIGMNKIKYTNLLGISIPIAAVVALGGLEAIAIWLLGKGKAEWANAATPVFICAILIFAYASVALPPVYGTPTSVLSFAPSTLPMLALYKSFEPRYQDNQVETMPKLAYLCEEVRKQGSYDDAICQAGYNESFAGTIDNQYDSRICALSQLTMEDLTPGSTESAKKSAYEAQVGANYRCGRLSDYWLDSMDWISKNLGQNDRVISWWDYGHWINYFGERKTVLRNEHLSTGMIGRVAHDFLIGSTQDLIDSMNYFDSQYALFDAEIIGGTGGQPFGNKYGALNYLGCSHEGETGVQNSPGSSQCEIDHSPERFAVYQSPPQSAVCVISESQQRSGILAYTYTFSPTGGIILQSPLYCIGDATLATGEKIYGTYYVDRKDSDGNLVLNKGTIRPIQKATDAADPATQYVIAEMVYNNSKVWLGENGTVVDGMSDAKTDFYRSNLYKGFFLNDLPGFDLVYTSKNGDVKIFKMKDSVFTGNKQGIVNETAAAMTQ